MPPGCPHAVFTPEDCLAVGGHFWTTAYLGFSLEVLRMQEDYPLICNKDIDEKIYISLGNIIEDCNLIMTDVAV